MEFEAKEGSKILIETGVHETTTNLENKNILYKLKYNLYTAVKLAANTRKPYIDFTLSLQQEIFPWLMINILSLCWQYWGNLNVSNGTISEAVCWYLHISRS